MHPFQNPKRPSETAVSEAEMAVSDSTTAVSESETAMGTKMGGHEHEGNWNAKLRSLNKPKNLEQVMEPQRRSRQIHIHNEIQFSTLRACHLPHDRRNS